MNPRAPLSPMETTVNAHGPARLILSFMVVASTVACGAPERRAAVVAPDQTRARVVSALARLDLVTAPDPNPVPALTPRPQGLSTVVTMTVRGPKQNHWPHAIPTFLLVHEAYETAAQAQARIAVFRDPRRPLVEVVHSYEAKTVFCMGRSVFFLSTTQGGLFGHELAKIARHAMDSAGSE